MSNRMASVLSADPAFNDFVAIAKRRNSAGVPCRSPQMCAAQPVHLHMWHHEDAGIGFNVFRAIVAANESAAIVPIPGHYNDAGIIERTKSAQDSYWSSRSIFVHGIKGPVQFEAAKQKWHIARQTPFLALRCYPCHRPGINLHHGDWQWARLPCPPAISGDQCALDGAACPDQERMCPVNPSLHFQCCGWPWLVPELRNLIVDVLRTAPKREGASQYTRLCNLYRAHVYRCTWLIGVHDVSRPQATQFLMCWLRCVEKCVAVAQESEIRQGACATVSHCSFQAKMRLVECFESLHCVAMLS